MLQRHPEKHTKEWSKKGYMTKHQMLSLCFLICYIIQLSLSRDFGKFVPSVAPVVLCRQLALGPRKLEEFQETRLHKSTWVRLLINMKVFDEKCLAEGNMPFHLLVSAQSFPRRLQPAALPYGLDPGE